MKKSLISAIRCAIMVTMSVVTMSACTGEGVETELQAVPVKPTETPTAVVVKSYDLEDAGVAASFEVSPFNLESADYKTWAYFVTYESVDGAPRKEISREKIEQELGLSVNFNRLSDVYVATEAELSNIAVKSVSKSAKTENSSAVKNGNLMTSSWSETFVLDQNEELIAAVNEQYLQKGDTIFPCYKVEEISAKEFKAVKDEQLSNVDSIVYNCTALMNVAVNRHNMTITRAADGTESYVVEVPFRRIYKTGYVAPTDEYVKTIAIEYSNVLKDNTRIFTVKTAEIWTLSGQKNEKVETLVRPFGLAAPAKQTIYSENADYRTVTNGMGRASEETSVEGNFTVTTRTMEYTSTANNNYNPFNNVYTITDVKVVYSYNGVEVEFPYGTWSCGETGSTVNAAGEENGYNVYDYVNNIDYVYSIVTDKAEGTAKAEAKILVKKAPEDKIVGYDLEGEEKVEDGKVIYTVTPITIYSIEGRVAGTPVTLELPFTFTAPAAQNIYTTNATYTTKSNGKTEGSETSKSQGNWTIKTLERTYSSTADNGNKSFDNVYTMTDSKVTYTWNGKTISFDYGQWNITEGKTTIGSATENGEYMVYPYVNNVSYVYNRGGEKVEGSAKAEASIFVKKEVTPDPKDEITGYDLEGSHKIENGNRVFTVTPITIYSISGRVAGTPETYSCAINFVNPSSQDIYTSNVNYNTVSNGMKNGSESSKNDGNWTVKTMSRSYSSTAANGDKSFDNNYTMSDSKVSYSWNGKTYTFEYGTWEVVEVSSTVGSANESGDYEVYPYANKVSYTFTAGSEKMTGNGQSNVALFVKKEAPQPTDEFQKTVLINKTDVIDGDNRVITVQTADVWSVSGQHETVTEKITLPISFSSPNAQNVYTANANYTTSSNGMKNGSESSRNEGNFSVKTMNRTYSSTAANGDKSFNNVYSMSDSKVTYKKNDVTLSFDYGTWNVTEASSTVGSATESGDYNVYPYTNKVNYTYSIASGSKSGNGTSSASIYVKIEKPEPEEPQEPEAEKIIPESWGKIIGAGISAVPSDDLGDKTNIAKKCLTIRTDKGAVAVVFDWNNNICSTSAVTSGYFVEGSFDGSYNSGYWTTSANKGSYETGKWAPAIAKDESDRIAYYSGSTKVRQVKHSVLDMWGWKNGHSTKVSGYTFSVSENGTLTVQKDGAVVMTIR